MGGPDRGGWGGRGREGLVWEDLIEGDGVDEVVEGAGWCGRRRWMR